MAIFFAVLPLLPFAMSSQHEWVVPEKNGWVEDIIDIFLKRPWNFWVS